MRAPLARCLAVAIVVALFAAAVPARAQAPAVSKVEPPNWWPGHSLSTVRVLLHGRHLAGATVDAVGAGVTVGLTRANAAGTYLFVDVRIDPSAPPGLRTLRVRTGAGTADVPFEVSAPLPRAGRFQGLTSDDVVYQLMPDRFADGDPSNDDPAGSRGLFDRSKPRYYHGGDFKGVIDKLPYLEALGVTAIWLNPWYDNVNHLNERERYDGLPITDYHGYGAVDFYGVEEHFGTMADLRALVDAAHAAGLKVVQDQVANHTGPYHPWVERPAHAHVVQRHGRAPRRQHVADVDPPGPARHARDAARDARRLVHRHPARPEPGRRGGRAVPRAELALVGWHAPASTPSARTRGRTCRARSGSAGWRR